MKNATPSNTTAQQIPTLLKRPEVEQLTRMSRSQIYALMSRGEFPTAIKLSSMSVAWIESEIHNWVAARIADSRKASKN